MGIFRDVVHGFCANLGRFLVLAAVLIPGKVFAQPLIVDHTCIDLDQVPAGWVETAKTQFLASYGHTSHGSQIVSGINVFKYPEGSLYWWDQDGTEGGLSLHDYTPSGDLGNPDRTTWAVRTRTMLDTPGNDRNLVIWSWCGQADCSEAEMQIYLDLMTGLINDYSNVTFVYMTGHLTGSGVEGNLNARNNQIRDHVNNTDGVLFDFADIESYDPDRNFFLPLYADDECYYWLESVQYNWADQWCDANPGSVLCSGCSCAHSRSLNCDMKGRAFWWMLARLAGWPGPGQSCPCDLNGDLEVNEEDLNQVASNWRYSGVCEEDLNSDGQVDLRDACLVVDDWGFCP